MAIGYPYVGQSGENAITGDRSPGEPGQKASTAEWQKAAPMVPRSNQPQLPVWLEARFDMQAIKFSAKVVASMWPLLCCFVVSRTICNAQKCGKQPRAALGKKHRAWPAGLCSHVWSYEDHTRSFYRVNSKSGYPLLSCGLKGKPKRKPPFWGVPSKQTGLNLAAEPFQFHVSQQLACTNQAREDRNLSGQRVKSKWKRCIFQHSAASRHSSLSAQAHCFSVEGTSGKLHACKRYPNLRSCCKLPVSVCELTLLAIGCGVPNAEILRWRQQLHSHACSVDCFNGTKQHVAGNGHASLFASSRRRTRHQPQSKCAFCLQ